MLKSLLLFIKTFICLLYPLYAGHPLITDDTGTLGKGHFQLELTPEIHNQTDEQCTDIPFALTYGLSDYFDIICGIQYQHHTQINPDKYIVAGFSDFSLEIKWVLLQKEKYSIAMKPGLSLPVGDHNSGLGAGKTGYSMSMITTYQFKEFMIHFNGGYLRNENRCNDRVNLWHISAGMEIPISSKLSAVMDTGVNKNSSKTANYNPAFSIFGLVYSIEEIIDLDLGIKHSFTANKTDLVVLAGITLSQ